jgi:dihydrofolate reductase
MNYELETDHEVTEVGFCMHDTLRCGVSPDGLIGDDGGIEIKCPKPSTHVKYLRKGTLPSEYKAQVMGCLWITGRQWWDFMSYHPQMPNLLIRVHRDDEYINQLERLVTHACQIIEKEVAEIKEKLL